MIFKTTYWECPKITNTFAWSSKQLVLSMKKKKLSILASLIWKNINNGTQPLKQRFYSKRFCNLKNNYESILILPRVKFKYSIYNFKYPNHHRHHFFLNKIASMNKVQQRAKLFIPLKSWITNLKHLHWNFNQILLQIQQLIWISKKPIILNLKQAWQKKFW